jgi:hypothetical protein
MSALEKKKFMDSALSWLRANEDNVGDIDDFTVQALADIAGISLPRTTYSSGDKEAKPSR